MEFVLYLFCAVLALLIAVIVWLISRLENLE